MHILKYTYVRNVLSMISFSNMIDNPNLDELKPTGYFIGFYNGNSRLLTAEGSM